MSLLLAARLDADEEARWIDALREAMPGEFLQTLATLSDPGRVEVALLAQPPPGALQGLPRLRLLQSLWAGVDGLLADATLPAGLPLARMVDPAMNRGMAETALWAVLGLHRGGFEHAQAQRERRWQPVLQRRADEVPVAVLGLGQMGRAVARRLADNGYPVIGWSRSPVQLDEVQTRHGTPSLGAVLAACEIVVNLLPLTDATRGFFDAGRFAAMRPGAALVNLGRGAHVVEAELLDALDSGRLSRAVLDVCAVEPLPDAHPFWTHPRVVVWPHAAAQTDPRSAARVVAENVAALRAGRPLAHQVDRRRGY